jgi:hypothetical protein
MNGLPHASGKAKQHNCEAAADRTANPQLGFSLQDYRHVVTSYMDRVMLDKLTVVQLANVSHTHTHI